MSRWQYVAMLLIALLVLLLILCLGGCQSQRHRAQTLNLDFSTGCHWSATGLQIAEVEEVMTNWHFEYDPETGACIVKVDETDKSSAKHLPPFKKGDTQ